MRRSYAIVISFFVLLTVVIVPVPLRAQEAQQNVPSDGQEAQEIEAAAREALRSGEYENARALYQTLLTSEANGTMHAGALAETYLATGDYEEGLREIDSRLRSAPEDPYLLYARGRLLKAVGRYQEAEQAFRKSGTEQSDYWPNVLEYGLLLKQTGRKQDATRFFDAIYSQYKDAAFRTADLIGIAGKAAAELEAFHDANDAFRRAHELDPTHIQNLYWWADLFRSKYNEADALRTFEEALNHNPHSADLLVGYARSHPSFGQQEELAHAALDENSRSVDALVLLAELRILDALYGEAEEMLDEALAINPSYVPALAHLASIHHLRGDATAFTAIEKRALEINPQAGDFYVTIAENCNRRFRYPDAAEFGRKAVEIDRDNVNAYASLGVVLLRLGEVREARRYLEVVYDRDPFNLFAGNTLTLLDEYANFDELESEHFVLVIHKDESAVLGPSILSLAEVCYDSLTARYPYRPEGKIRIEAYNDHADFAVRIAGIPHLGLLGVSFGDVVAFDTPRAQTDDEHNWARTLWHELAHTMAIGVSGFRVPRWFTEGLSVYEERRARPEWGREMELEFFSALDRDLLLPLEQIDRGFTRPEFPGQILLSYYHASKIIEYISDTYGFKSVTGILSALKEGLSIDASIQRVLGVPTAALDQSFRENLKAQRQQYAQVLNDLPDLLGQEQNNNSAEKLAGSTQNALFSALRRGHELLDQKQYPEAETQFQKALEIYPGYTDEGNAYVALAELYKLRNDTSKELQILEQYLRIADYGATETRRLAGLYLGAQNVAKAEHYFRRSLDVEPYNVEAHIRLAELYEGQHQYDRAITARRAVLALNPVDRASALYHLAANLYAAGRANEAKRVVLQALEQAPGYRDAQKLLLKCVSAAPEEES